MTTQPLRKIQQALLDLDETPLLGAPPPFPGEAVESALARLLELDSVHLEADAPSWRKGEEVTAGLGSETTYLHLVATPLEFPFVAALPNGEIDALLKLLLKTDGGGVALQDSALREALVQRVAVEVLAAIGSAGYPGDLKFQLAGTDTPPIVEALTVDFSAALKGLTLRGRLLLPHDFVRAWRQHFASAAPSKIAETLEVDVGLQGGTIALPHAQWTKLQVGDLLMLDTCSVDPTTGHGGVALTLEGNTLLQGQLTKTGIQF